MRRAIYSSAEKDLNTAIYLFEIVKEGMFYMKFISSYRPYEYLFFTQGQYNVPEKIMIVESFQRETDEIERFINHKIKYKDAFKNSR